MSMENIEENKMLQRGKREALRIIFGRTMVIVLLFLIQIVMIGAVVRYFGRYIPVFFGGYMLFALAIVLIIINKEGSPEINAAGISGAAKETESDLQADRRSCAAG